VSGVRIWCFGVGLKLFSIQDKSHQSLSHKTKQPSNSVSYVAELFENFFWDIRF